MTKRIGDVVVIEGEEDRRCELCGDVAECRPAGPKGEQVCFECAQKDQAAMKRYTDRLFGRGLGIVEQLQRDAPKPPTEEKKEKL